LKMRNAGKEINSLYELCKIVGVLTGERGLASEEQACTNRRIKRASMEKLQSVSGGPGKTRERLPHYSKEILHRGREGGHLPKREGKLLGRSVAIIAGGIQN